MKLRLVCVASAMVLAVFAPVPMAEAQQRPLVTEDPEPIGAGRVLIEGGFDYSWGQHYPVSGLQGDQLRLPTLGVSVGISSIAEFQLDGGLFNHLSVTTRDPGAPLASLVTFTGTSTNDVEDIVIATKIRVAPEQGNRPSFALRFATKLPTASNESGLGTDSFDFYTSLLAAHAIKSVRVVGNVGFGILADPSSGNRQNDVLTYGVSAARAITEPAEVVVEINGRVNTRSDSALPGSETRGTLRLGGRYTRGPARYDVGVLFGLTTVDPTFGITAGFTYVFNGFTVP